MKQVDPAPLVIGSIPEFCRLLGLPKPGHPLVSVIRFESIQRLPEGLRPSVVLNFFSIWLEKDCNGRMPCGHQPYNFNEGMMSFFLPGQVLTGEAEGELKHRGWWLLIHPEFLWNYPIAMNIRQYGFFSYAVNEALHLSEKEERLVTGILQNIEQEYLSPTDLLSQEAILSQVETLLIYSERFYQRQFITRKKANPAVLGRLEEL